jgi:hypothetical protein
MALNLTAVTVRHVKYGFASTIQLMQKHSVHWFDGVVEQTLPIINCVLFNFAQKSVFTEIAKSFSNISVTRNIVQTHQDIQPIISTQTTVI